MISTKYFLRMLALICLSGSAAALAQKMPPAPVITDYVEMKLLAPSAQVPGTVVSHYDSRLAAELDAKLTWIAEVGTEVKEGDTVARLEDFTFKIREMEAQSGVEREQARITFLQSELERLIKLASKNLSAQSRLDQTESDLAIAEAEYTIAQAQLGYAQIAMHITQIRAPFDGVVTERLRNIGERLSVADVVIRLVDPNALEVVARAPLNSVNFIRKGDVLQLNNDYRSGDATIRTIVPFGDPQSHMFEVRLDVDSEVWTIGESLRLSMPTAEAKEVLAVPRDALIIRREGTSVFKLLADATVVRVNVIVGMGAGRHIEVFGDLEAGDEVIVRGAERLNDGMTVASKRAIGNVRASD